MPITATVPETTGITVATVVLLLVHAPPVMPSVSVVVAPGHRWAVPVMAVGVRSTVTIAAAAQPVAVMV